MGQVLRPKSPQTLILTATDRLVASNADGGISPLASHLVLLGEDAGQNLGDLDYVYVIGASALDAGLTNTNQTGTVVIGGLSLGALTNANLPATDRPLTVVGYDNFPLQSGRLGGQIVIGSNIGDQMPALASDSSGSVMIGVDVIGNQRILNANGGNGYTNSVFIGHRAMRGAVTIATDGGGATCGSSVVIGADAMGNSGFDLGTPGCIADFNVVVGSTAAQAAASAQNSTFTNNVVIGNACYSTVVNSTNSVAIGSGISGQPSATTGFVLLGNGIVGGAAANAEGNIVVGSSGNISGLGSGNILLGHLCNSNAALPAAAANRLLIEAVVGATRRTILYGLMSDVSPGGLVVGHSDGTNRDVPGLNILKLINGSYNGTPPVGGGFFYSETGGLHWVDPNGGDSLIAGPGAVETPAPLAAGNTNNYAINDATRTLRMEGDAGGGSILTGLAGGLPGREVTIFNIGALGDIIAIAEEDAASTAANRFALPVGSGAINVDAGNSVTLWYDTTSSRWRVSSFV